MGRRETFWNKFLPSSYLLTYLLPWKQVRSRCSKFFLSRRMIHPEFEDRLNIKIFAEEGAGFFRFNAKIPSAVEKVFGRKCLASIKFVAFVPV